MSGVDVDALREAREAWRSEERRLARPPALDLRILVIGLAMTVLTLIGVSLSAWRSLEGWRGALVLALGSGLALALVAVPLVLARRRASEARRAVESARGRRPRCPRCSTPLVESACVACKGALLEAEGLVIAYTSDAAWRRRRWQAAARLGPLPGEWALSPLLWIPASVAALVALRITAAALGGGVLEAPLGLERQVAIHPFEPASRALADASDVGPPTRARAPLWTGTRVLARRGAHHEPAVIVRVDAPRAFVVYASGEAGWVHANELLAPELAEGDEVEVLEEGRGMRAEIVRRMGPAVLVEVGGERRWTSFARLRVRSDARHRRGAGAGDALPPDAWIEAREGGAARPGILVEQREDGSARVAFSDGEERWVPREHVAPQRIGPGVRLRVDGLEGERIVAARVGDALAVVDERGTRSWTSLARVRR